VIFRVRYRNAFDRAVDFGLLKVRYGDDPCYRASLSGDDYDLPAFYVIEELGKDAAKRRNSLVDSTS
jgi:hypothetical protein